MSGWLLIAGIVLIIVIIVLGRRHFKAHVAHTAFGSADAWLKQQGFASDSVRFSSYTQPALVRRKGSTVLVGMGPRLGGDRASFVVEVGSDGSVEGAVLSSNLASWHQSAAREAVSLGVPLFTMMLQREARSKPDK